MCALLTVLAIGPAALSARAQSADEDSATSPSIQELSDRLDGMNEQMLTLQADTDKLKKFKFSGYVQARWETGETQSDTVLVSGTTITPANNERIFIRRARLKLTYDSSPLSQAVVYLDGDFTRTVRLLEAYVTLMDPWTAAHRHQLTVGQMNVPFGYEIERSSSTRELPERSRAENVLFAGERDRGVKLVSQWAAPFETVVGILNGGGVNHSDFPNADPTRAKDFVGRARLSLGWLDAAASYYHGENVVPLTGPDAQSDKTRLGFDAQLYYELPMAGGGSLRAEYYRGQELNPDSVTAYIVTVGTARYIRPGGHLDSEFVGGYAMWIQNLGERLQAAARWDYYDRNSDLDSDQYERIGMGLNWFHDGNVRVTVAYDEIKASRFTGGRWIDPKDNLWTVQFQHKF